MTISRSPSIFPALDCSRQNVISDILVAPVHEAIKPWLPALYLAVHMTQANIPLGVVFRKNIWP